MGFRLFRGAAIVGVTALGLLTASLSAVAATPGKPDNSLKPTVVLVHGAWADSARAVTDASVARTTEADATHAVISNHNANGREEP
ncbi:hypothetical protein [Actinomadura sp. DC4]|uniref:hypothetical protein n=1 Tax=Actinomadura sp. DC4 TaxID=3055069 RepID=UPI0025B1E7B9|nr:hypothetical protein [Actinomadura sp. DC4]MDN3358134.1 hypothetical protein [Actinomadura sp. DC4]